MPNTFTATEGPAGAPERESPPSRASIPLYVAGLVNIVSGLFAVNLVLDDPSFSNLTIGLGIIGWMVSLVSRKQSVSPRAIQVPALVFIGMFALMAVMSDQFLPFMAPAGIGDERQKSLAVLLTWGTVFLSFLLITDDMLLFSCVPTLALIGLAGTMTADPQLITTFVVFVCAASFMSVHENFLRTRRRESPARRPRTERQLFASQVQLAAACGIGALILAQIIAGPMSEIGSRLTISSSLVSPANRPSAAPFVPAVQFQERSELSVGLGPVKLSNEIVMRIRAEHGSYWRGATFDQYTGRGWRNNLAMPASVLPDSSASENFEELAEPETGPRGARFSIVPTALSRVGRGAGVLRQRITLTNAGQFSEIYAAPEARVLRVNADSIRVDESGSVHLNRPLQGTQYTVESQVADSSPERLKTASADYTDAIRDRYLKQDTLRGETLARLRQTAEQITQGAANNYERVRRLEQWVSSNCKYNLDAPAIPADQDVAEYFLFTSRQGYCDSFATSLAMLCRSIGIPARVASGFNPGTLDRESQEILVRERDKHLWTEVYFPGTGWVTFDATDGAEDISSSQDSAGKDRGILAFLFRRGWLPPLTLLAFLVMLAYVAKVEVIDRLRSRARENPLGFPPANLAVIDCYTGALKALARKGIAREPSHTPREFQESARALLGAWPDAVSALDRLTALHARCRYSREEATEADLRIAQESRETLQGVLRAEGRTIRREALAAGAE